VELNNLGSEVEFVNLVIRYAVFDIS